MEMPVLTEAHQKLKILAGDWVGEEKIYPSPFNSQGGTARARVHNALALEGFAVIQDYEQQRQAYVNFRGHGIFMWNRSLTCYSMYWFDSLGMPPVEYRGSFENDILELSYQTDQGHFRAVFDFSEADRYIFRQEVSPNGEEWLPFLEGSYVRAVPG